MASLYAYTISPPEIIQTEIVTFLKEAKGEPKTTLAIRNYLDIHDFVRYRSDPRLQKQLQFKTYEPTKDLIQALNKFLFEMCEEKLIKIYPSQNKSVKLWTI